MASQHFNPHASAWPSPSREAAKVLARHAYGQHTPRKGGQTLVPRRHKQKENFPKKKGAKLAQAAGRPFLEKLPLSKRHVKNRKHAREEKNAHSSRRRETQVLHHRASAAQHPRRSLLPRPRLPPPGQFLDPRSVFSHRSEHLARNQTITRPLFQC